MEYYENISFFLAFPIAFILYLNEAQLICLSMVQIFRI